MEDQVAELKKKQAEINRKLAEVKQNQEAKIQDQEIQIQEGITKKQAAIEVYTRLKSARLITVISIVGFLVVAGAATVKALYGSIMALVFSVALMVFLAVTVKEMSSLKFNYGIDTKGLK